MFFIILVRLLFIHPKGSYCFLVWTIGFSTVQYFYLTTTPNISGLSSGLFLTFDNIHRVVCSGASLEADVDVMAMVLYRVADDRVLAYVNQAKQECTTSELFVSCDVDTTDSKRSRLSVLISDLAEGETRTLGCNISTIAAGGRFRTLSWRIVLRQASKDQHRKSTTTFFIFFII